MLDAAKCTKLEAYVQDCDLLGRRIQGFSMRKDARFVLDQPVPVAKAVLQQHFTQPLPMVI
jgi:hypothetical protein